MIIRPATPLDYDQIWDIVHEVIAKGDTYTYPPECSKKEGLHYWIELARAVYVCQLEECGEIAGTFYIKTNMPGLSSHVCNSGFMTRPSARGHGVARAMCIHAQSEALTLGYLCMQFNSVVKTNTVAIQLWQKLGFSIVGELPKSFNHRELGLVNAYVMYKVLNED